MTRLFYAMIILFSSLNIGAQEVEMFYLNFFIKDVSETETETILTAKLGNANVEFNQAWEGSVVAVTTNPEEIGNVKFIHIADGGSPIVEIKIPKTIDAAEVMRYESSGLLKMKVKSLSIPAVKQSLIYELYRLQINIYSTLQEIPRYLLKGINTYAEEKFSADDFYIPDLVKESIEVANVMRGNMESVMIEEGKFKGMDVLTAMEKSNYWDVESFLKYMIDNYRVYQGKLGGEWKFSEIYGTWLMDGAKGNPAMNDEQLKAKLTEKLRESDFIGVKTYFESELLRGIDRKLLKELCQDFRAKSEWCLAHGVDGAYGWYVEAQNIAEYLEDKGELAWCDYLYGEESSWRDNFDFSIEEYKEALSYFKEVNDKNGLTKVYCGMGNGHNELNTNSGYKKALSLFKKALEHSEGFTGNDNAKSTTLALIYLNMGISHLGLGAAEIALKKGLEYANAKDILSYNRKASLEAKLVYAYKMMGDSGKQKTYEDKAAESKKIYLAELENNSSVK